MGSKAPSNDWSQQLVYTSGDHNLSIHLLRTAVGFVLVRVA